MKLPYHEGTCFAVPLDGGGHAVGVVARTSRTGGVFLAYLFGPVRESIPTLAEVESLTADEADKVWKVGDYELVNGGWPVIGTLPRWNRQDWPMPKFVRVDDLLSHTAWLATYDKDDPNSVPRERRIPYQPVAFLAPYPFKGKTYEWDGVNLAEFVQEVLPRFLKDEQPR